MRRLLIGCTLAATAITLTACGDDVATSGRPTSTSSTVSPATPTPPPTPTQPTSAPAPEVPGGTTIVVDDLPDGPPPQVDLLAGRTLYRQGLAIQVKDDLDPYVQLMGTYDDRIIVWDYSQFSTITDTGEVEPLGEPHESYNYPARLVRETGHLLSTYNDRGTSLSTYTFLDAVTGEEVAVLQDRRGRPADLGGLEPADRAAIETMNGDRPPPEPVDAPEPAFEIEVEAPDRDDPHAERPAVLTVRRTDGDREVVSRLVFPPYFIPDAPNQYGGQGYFASVLGGAVLESDDAFLVVGIPEGGAFGDGPVVVLRCTTTAEPTCERATRPARSVAFVNQG